MRIPSGDLAPMRKSRRRYGRRRSRLPLVLAALVLVAVAVGAWQLLLRDDDPATGEGDVLAQECGPTPAPSTTTAPPAAVPAPAPAVTPVVLPAPGEVRLTLFNGTSVSGLGATVGDELAARGFGISGTGNAPVPQDGASVVNHGPGAAPAAQQVAAQVLDSTVVEVAGAAPGSVSLVLGSGYTRLRDATEVAAYVAALATPAPTQDTAAPPAAEAPDPATTTAPGC